jgi:hypothetical protein
LRNPKRHAAISHDLDAPLGEHRIDQHAVVVLGILHAKLAKQRRKTGPKGEQHAFSQPSAECRSAGACSILSRRS